MPSNSLNFTTMEHVSRISVILIAIIAYCAVGNCAESEAFFKYTENNQYYIQPFRNYTWQEAFENCDKKGMDLLTIETPEKSKEVENLLYSIYSNKLIPGFHIGANDLEEFRKFSWIKLEGRKPFTYTNWLPNEPNNYREFDERCVQIGHKNSIQWNDVSCNYKFGFICQGRIDFKTLMNHVAKGLKALSAY